MYKRSSWISWYLKEQLHIHEQEGRSMLPPLGKEGDAAPSCKTTSQRDITMETK